MQWHVIPMKDHISRLPAGPQIQGERCTFDTAEEGLYGGCLVSSLGRQWG